MNEHMKMWIEALRSGEYTQGYGQLRSGDDYCCLGVACDVYRRSTHQGHWTYNIFELDLQEAAHTFMPIAVAKWLSDQDIDQSELVALNDGDPGVDEPMSFLQIAQWLEDHYV